MQTERRDTVGDEETSVGKIALCLAKSGATELPLERLLKQTSNITETAAFKRILKSELGSEYFEVDNNDCVRLRVQQLQFYKPGPGADAVIDEMCAALLEAGPCFVRSKSLRQCLIRRAFAYDGAFPSLSSAMRYAHSTGRVVLYGERGTIASLVPRKPQTPTKTVPTMREFPPLVEPRGLLELQEMLDTLRLENYFQPLDDFGVSCVADIALLTPADFASMGIKPFHQRKLQSAPSKSALRVVAIAHSSLDGYCCAWSLDGSTLPEEAKALFFFDWSTFHHSTNIDASVIVYVMGESPGPSSSVVVVQSLDEAMVNARARKLSALHLVMGARTLVDVVDEVIVYMEPRVGGTDDDVLVFGTPGSLSLIATKRERDLVMLHYAMESKRSFCIFCASIVLCLCHGRHLQRPRKVLHIWCLERFLDFLHPCVTNTRLSTKPLQDARPSVDKFDLPALCARLHDNTRRDKTSYNNFTLCRQGFRVESTRDRRTQKL